MTIGMMGIAPRRKPTIRRNPAREKKATIATKQLDGYAGDKKVWAK